MFNIQDNKEVDINEKIKIFRKKLNKEDLLEFDEIIKLIKK